MPLILKRRWFHKEQTLQLLLVMMLPFGFKPDQVFAANLISWLYSYDTRVLTEAKDEAENRCALLHRSNKLLAVALSRDRDRLGVTES